MKILITGATGFIGKRLAEELSKEGHDLVCLVRKTSNIDFLKTIGVTFVTGDVQDENSVQEAIRDHSPEVVYHAAATVMEKNETKLYAINVGGTQNVSKACYDNGVSKLIYLSSIAVISGNEQGPLTDELPYSATNAYGRSKIEAEKIAIKYREKGLNTVIIRPCMIYGEDEPHALDAIFKLARLHLVPISNVPGMDAALHLGYVGNLVQALIQALYIEEATQGTFIIADREAVTLRKFIELIHAGLEAGKPPVVPAGITRILMKCPFLGQRIKWFFKDRVYDITRAKNILKYNPELSTEEAVRKTTKTWFDKNNG